MKDSMSFDCTPYDESPCTSEIGSPEEAAEAKRMLEMLNEIFINLPKGTRFFIKSNPHDFGYYKSIEFEYNDDIESHVDAMLFVESNWPSTWNDTAVRNFALSKE